MVVDGFFPASEPATKRPQRVARAASSTSACPMRPMPAVTRHVAAFLQQHRSAGWPDALLLNGGVFRAHAIAARLQATLAHWSGRPLRLLQNEDPDVAVARGAVAYALARRGLAPRITGGSPRGYFLRLEDGADGDAMPGVCLLPQGTEEGHELRLEGRRFALCVGEPVRFHVVATTAEVAGQAAPAAGELIDLDRLDAQALPPLATVVRGEGRARHPRATGGHTDRGRHAGSALPSRRRPGPALEARVPVAQRAGRGRHAWPAAALP